MEKDIKLLALDLDGTTFTSDKKITDRTKEAIRKAAEKGVIVMPASGRNMDALPEDLISLKGIKYAITANGAVVYELKNRRPICENLVPADLAIRLADDLLKYKGMVEFYTDGHSYADKAGFDRLLKADIPEWFKEYMRNYKIPVEDLKGRVHSGLFKVEKFVLTFDDMDERKAAFAHFSDWEDIEVAQGTTFNMEINSAGGTKANALRQFTGLIGLKIENVMAIGDSTNDIAMLKAAGVSVAMGNALDKVKEVADIITATNDEDGVAQIIEKYII